MEPVNPITGVVEHGEQNLGEKGGDLQVVSLVDPEATHSESVIVIDTSFATRRPAAPKGIQRLPVELFVMIFSFMQPALPDAASWIYKASQNDIDGRFTWLVVTLVCKKWRAIARSAPSLWNTLNSQEHRIFGVLIEVDDEGKVVLKFPGSSHPLLVFLQPGGPHNTFLTKILPYIPSIQPVFFAITDAATMLQAQLLMRQYNLCVKSLTVSNPIDAVAGPPALEGTFPSVESLGLSNQLTSRNVHLENLRVLLIEHMRFETPHQVETLTTMLQAMPVLDDLKFKDVIATSQLKNIANQHRLASTNIKRIRFEYSSGVDILLTCIGIPVGVEIVVQDSLDGAILPKGDSLRGELAGYDTAMLSIRNGNFVVEISQGSTKLTAEWMDIPGRWDAGFGALIEGVRDLTIRSDEVVDFTHIYPPAWAVETLHLQLSHHDGLLNALAPLGMRFDEGPIYPELEELRELHFCVDWAWVDVLQAVGTVLEEREEQESLTIEYVIDSGRFGGAEVSKEAPEEWVKAEAKLAECAKRIKAAHNKRMAEEGCSE